MVFKKFFFVFLLAYTIPSQGMAPRVLLSRRPFLRLSSQIVPSLALFQNKKSGSPKTKNIFLPFLGAGIATAATYYGFDNAQCEPLKKREYLPTSYYSAGQPLHIFFENPKDKSTPKIIFINDKAVHSASEAIVNSYEKYHRALLEGAKGDFSTWLQRLDTSAQRILSALFYNSENHIFLNGTSSNSIKTQELVTTLFEKLSYQDQCSFLRDLLDHEELFFLFSGSTLQDLFEKKLNQNRTSTIDFYLKDRRPLYFLAKKALIILTLYYNQLNSETKIYLTTLLEGAAKDLFIKRLIESGELKFATDKKALTSLFKDPSEFIKTILDNYNFSDLSLTCFTILWDYAPSEKKEYYIEQLIEGGTLLKNPTPDPDYSNNLKKLFDFYSSCDSFKSKWANLAHFLIENLSKTLSEYHFYTLIDDCSQNDIESTLITTHPLFKKSSIKAPLTTLAFIKNNWNQIKNYLLPSPTIKDSNLLALVWEIQEYVLSEYEHNKIVFFHGRSAEWGFLNAFYKELQKTFLGKCDESDTFIPLRFTPQGFLSEKETTHIKTYGDFERNKKLLFTNLHLLAGSHGENSYHYIHENFDQTAKDKNTRLYSLSDQNKTSLLLIKIFKDLGLSEQLCTLQNHPYLLDELDSLYQEALQEQGYVGLLLTISMPRPLAQKITYLTDLRTPGNPYKITINKQKTDDVTLIADNFEQVPFDNQYCIILSGEILDPQRAQKAGVIIKSFDPVHYQRTEKYLKFERRLQQIVVWLKNPENELQPFDGKAFEPVDNSFEEYMQENL